MKKNNQLVVFEYLKKNIPEIYKKEVSYLYKEMDLELKKKQNFAEKLAVVTDTIENIFNIINNKRIISYSDFAVKRKKRLCHKIKKIKKIKKCKKLMRV